MMGRILPAGRHLLTAFTVLSLLLVGTVHAQTDTPIPYSQKTETLTKQNIERFLNKTKDISVSAAPGLIPADISAYLTRHIAGDSQFTSQITYNVPGYAPQTNEMKIDKDGYIAAVLEGQNLLRDYTVTTVINRLDVSNAGRAARIYTRAEESGDMLWPDGEGGKEYLPMTGVSVCQQDIILSNNNYIQMAGALCETTVNFKPQDTAPLDKDKFVDDFYDW